MKTAFWFRSNWIDDNYRYFKGNLDKFLKSNVGRPVDKVFSEFTVDPTVSLKIIDGKSPTVFKKYRKELNEVIKGTLYNYVKDAFRIQLNKFTTDDIVSK